MRPTPRPFRTVRGRARSTRGQGEGATGFWRGSGQCSTGRSTFGRSVPRCREEAEWQPRREIAPVLELGCQLHARRRTRTQSPRSAASARRKSPASRCASRSSDGLRSLRLSSRTRAPSRSPRAEAARPAARIVALERRAWAIRRVTNWSPRAEAVRWRWSAQTHATMAPCPSAPQVIRDSHPKAKAERHIPSLMNTRRVRTHGYARAIDAVVRAIARGSPVSAHGNAISATKFRKTKTNANQSELRSDVLT